MRTLQERLRNPKWLVPEATLETVATRADMVAAADRMDAIDLREQKLVAQAIKAAWEKLGEVPFPLYSTEADELAAAAIGAMNQARNG